MSEIVRKAIKIRQPIHREYCECHNVQVVSTNGTPYVWIADKLSREELDQFLTSHSVVTPALFESVDEDKIDLCLSYNVPVSIVTSSAVSPDLINRMAAVARCSIQTSIESLGRSIGNSVSPEPPAPFALLQMMHSAKSRKIYQSLEVSWYPHLMNKFDLFEAIDTYRNYTSHIVLKIPQYLDLVYKVELDRWLALGICTAEDFKHYYVRDVPGRSWKVRSKYKEEILSEVEDFIKVKKLSMEYVEWDASTKRIRHRQEGTSKYPMGMINCLYQKGEDGKFILTPEATEAPCAGCGRTLFI